MSYNWPNPATKGVTSAYNKWGVQGSTGPINPYYDWTGGERRYAGVQQTMAETELLRQQARKQALVQKLLSGLMGQGDLGGFFGQITGAGDQPAGQSFTAETASPSAGAINRALSLQEASNQRATTEQGLATAGGAFGTTRGALAGAARSRAQGGAQARALGTDLLEQDVTRGTDLAQFNASQQQQASMANADRSTSLINQILGLF